MADFVAVIRRAVDGLSDNTPEMRARVYEKARGAVVRQLENMKPRPPELMFQRQISKLDEAIRQVEDEHSEALPETEATEPPPVVVMPEPEPAPEPEPETRQVDEPQYEAEPQPEPEPEQEAEPEAYASEEIEPGEEAVHEVSPEPADAEALEPAQIRVVEEEPVHPVEPESEWPDEVPAETVSEDEAREIEEARPVEDDVVVSEEPEDLTPQAAYFDPEEHDPAENDQPDESEPDVHPARLSAVDHGEDHHRIEPTHALEEERGEIEEEEAVEPLVIPPPIVRAFEAPLEETTVEAPSVEAPTIEPASAPTVDAQDVRAAMPKVSYDESEVVSGFNAFVQAELNRAPTPPPQRKDDGFSWDAPFDDLPDLPKPVAFEQALEAKQKEIRSEPEVEAPVVRKTETDPVAAPEAKPDPKAELEDLIGYDRHAAAVGATEDGLPPEVKKAVSRLERKSFRVSKQKKSRRVTPITLVLAGVGILLLGGVGLAAWQYAGTINSFVAGLMASTPSAPEEADTTADKPADTTAAPDTASDNTETAKADIPATPEDQPKTPTTAADGLEKFTQRLLPDGSETSPDPGVSVDGTLPEGKTVAGQTEVAQNNAATPQDDTAAPTDATEDQTPAADPDQPLGATQKMFLYEERLGQSSPVAVMGTVSWREKNESSAANAKPEPAIVAQIDVPGRKMKALVTFNRNTDPSLPASHFIEVVFDLPDDFEEGNIANIQRITFKQTEQDRGNALIGVPVKVTDDYHMIALNDDADAIKTNLDLMKTRDWIDIPITYRNGRRALITMEKGATGTKIFDKVMAEWAALGDSKSN